MSPDYDTLKAEFCRRHFQEFVKAFWSIIEPHPFQHGYHIDAICEHLENIREIKNLLVCMPPRMAKSTLISTMFPAWYWISQPQAKFLCASYALQLSIRDSVRCRRLIESDRYQRWYGSRFKITTDQNTKVRYENDRTGVRLATSIEGSVVGEGATITVLDDPMNIEEVESRAYREQVSRWFSSVWFTRLDDPVTGCRIVVMQRCHPQDLASEILANDTEGDWTKLILPMEFGKSKDKSTRWADPRTEEGELLCPDRIPKKEVELLKRQMGKRAFDAQYNQSPKQQGESIFDPENFKHYNPGDYDPTAAYRIAAVDLAISAKGDYTVCIVADVTPQGDIYLVHMLRERMPSPKIVPALEAINNTYRPLLMYVEDVGFQKLVIDQLRLKRIPVRGVTPISDKVSRSVMLQCKLEAGQLFVPEHATWRTTFEDELTDFPGAPHDDCVDTASYLAIEGDKLSRHPPQWRTEKPLTPEEEKKHQEQQAIKRFRAMLLEGIL